MGICDNRTCINAADLRCAGCKTASGSECQRVAWANGHKKTCKEQRELYDRQQEREAEMRANPPKKPRRTHCTGCNVRFSEDYRADGDCPDCGYMTCESCSCSNRRGSCYCQNSNFGHLYCNSAPQDYHVSSRTGQSYRGDRHPDNPWEANINTHPHAFEAEPRACKNCGKVTRCLKLEYL